MKRLIIIVLLASCGSSEKVDLEGELWPLMLEQQAAWNAGDIHGFMDIYDDDVCFLGRKGLTCGKKAVTQDYEESYPNPTKMGQLEFDNTEYLQIEEQCAWLTGRWTLYRVSDTLSGNYSLLWRETDQGWRIFRDHSDSDCN